MSRSKSGTELRICKVGMGRFVDLDTVGMGRLVDLDLYLDMIWVRDGAAAGSDVHHSGVEGTVDLDLDLTTVPGPARSATELWICTL